MPPERIRLLRAITWLPPGGIERKLVEVLPRLDRDRFEVSLVCLREPGPLAPALQAAGIEVHCVPFRRRWDLAALRRLTRWMRAKRIQIVHSHMYRANVPTTVAARWAGLRHVWAQVHNVATWETPRQAAVDRFLCRWREGMLAVSEEVRRDVIQRLRLRPEKVRLLYNGVDVARFGSGRGRGELRREAGVADDDLVFLFAARLVEQKRPQDFLTLAEGLLARETGRPGRQRAWFWVLGGGPLRASLLDRAAPLGDRVRFLGPREDIERIMAAADLFIMTSTREGFSNALLEAMASGLTIIATRVGGNAEALRHEEDGLLVPPLRRDALAEAAERLLADADLRRRLAASARRRAGEFSLETMVRNLERLYEECVGRA